VEAEGILVSVCEGGCLWDAVVEGDLGDDA